MAITRNDSVDVYGKNGLISSTPVVTDITHDSNYAFIVAALNQAITANNTALPDAAIQTNISLNNTYLGLSSPTQAQTNSQVNLLTQQVNAIIPNLKSQIQQSTYIMGLVLYLLGEITILESNHQVT